MKWHRRLDIDEYEKLKKTNFEDFNRESFLIKRGANRAKLYHKYRKDLIENFQPQPDVLEKTNKILQEIF